MLCFFLNKNFGSISATYVAAMEQSKATMRNCGYDSVYISPDRSAEQKAAFKKLVLAVKQKRLDEPERVHVIRNNKIVSSDKE